jgi:hypothetical protein
MSQSLGVVDVQVGKWYYVRFAGVLFSTRERVRMAVVRGVSKDSPEIVVRKRFGFRPHAVNRSAVICEAAGPLWQRVLNWVRGLFRSITPNVK